MLAFRVVARGSSWCLPRCRPLATTSSFWAQKNNTVPSVAKSLSERDNKLEKNAIDTNITDDLLADVETDKALEDQPTDSVIEEEREFATLQLEDFAEIYQDDSDLRELIEKILSEYEFAKYNSVGKVPSTISVGDMRSILNETSTASSRDKYFYFLFKREMARRAGENRRLRLKEEIRIKREAKHKIFAQRAGNRRTGLLTDDGKLMYGLWHNNLFCRIPENKLKNGLSQSRLAVAAQFGRKVIFDFDYGDYMNNYAHRNVLDQIQEAYGLNRHFKEPLDIWFCNLKENSMEEDYLQRKALQNLYTSSMITVKNDCFTNHFDKSRLVYLSPNAKEPLGKITRSDDIYIIGVFNDKGNHQPVSHRKALKLGIKTKCLPLDSHVAWQGASKSLCVQHVTGILLEVLSNGGDWQAALLKHVPARKIKSNETVMEEEAIRQARIKKHGKSSGFSLRRDMFD